MKKQNLKKFLVIFFITMCVTGLYFSEHYVTDAYKIVNIGFEEYSKVKVGEGRLILYCMCKIINFIIHGKIDMTTYLVIYRVLLLITNIILSASILIVYNKIIEVGSVESKKVKILVFISILTSFYCLSITECLLFIENVAMITSLLLATIAAIKYSKRRYILSILILIVGVFCYQGTINFFVAFAFFLVTTINENKKIQLKDALKIGGIYLITLVINFIFIKIIGTENRIIVEPVKILKNISSIVIFSVFYIILYVIIISVLGIIFKLKREEYLNLNLLAILSTISCTALLFGSSSRI